MFVHYHYYVVDNKREEKIKIPYFVLKQFECMCTTFFTYDCAHLQFKRVETSPGSIGPSMAPDAIFFFSQIYFKTFIKNGKKA